MDQLYIEQGYKDASYYNIVAEAVVNISGVLTASVDVKIADATGYYIEGYVEVGYVETTEFSGVVKEFEASLTAFANSTLTANVVKNQFAILDNLITMSATASKVASNTITLESIINQSMMDDAPRIRFFTFSTNASDPLNADFTTLRSTIFIDVTRVDVFRTTDVTLNSVASLETNPTKTTDITANIDTVSTVNADVENVVFLDNTNISAEFISNIPYAESFVERTFTNRPYTPFTGYVFTGGASGAQTQGAPAPIITADIARYANNKLIFDGKYANGTNLQAYMLPFVESRQTASNSFYSSDFYIAFDYNVVDPTVNRNNTATIFRLGEGTAVPTGTYITEIQSNITGTSGQDTGYWAQEAVEVYAVRTSDSTPYNSAVKVNIGGVTHTLTASGFGGTYRIIRSGNTVSFYRNNTLGSSVAVSGSLRQWRYIGLYPHEEPYSGQIYSIGNLIIKNGSSVGTYTAPQNDEDTFAFYTFNNTLLDTTTNFLFIADPIALTGSAATITAVPNSILDGVTIHLGTFGIDINPVKITEPRSQLLSDFAVYADPILVVTMQPADLSVAATATIEAGVQTSADADIASQATVTINATRVRTANITTESIATAINVINFIGNTLTEFTPGVFSTTIDADRLRGIDDNLETVVSTTIAAGKTPKFDATNFETAFSVDADISYRPFVFMDKGALALLTVDVNRTRDNDAVMVSAAALEAVTRGILPGNATLNVNANLTVIPSVTRTFDGAFDATIFVNAEGIKAVTGETILASAFITTTDNSRIRDVNTQFDSIATDISTAVKIGDFLITLESAFTTVTNAGFNASANATIDTASIIEITAERLRGIEAASNAESTLSATGRFTSDAALDAVMALALAADAVRIADANAILTDAMTFASTVRATRNNEVSVYSESSMSVINGRVRTSQASVTSQASIQVDAATRVGIIAQLDSAFEITADGKEIHILEIVYTIPRENRTFRISKETRTYKVQFENREYTLGD